MFHGVKHPALICFTFVSRSSFILRSSFALPSLGVRSRNGGRAKDLRLHIQVTETDALIMAEVRTSEVRAVGTGSLVHQYRLYHTLRLSLVELPAVGCCLPGNIHQYVYCVRANQPWIICYLHTLTLQLIPVVILTFP